MEQPTANITYVDSQGIVAITFSKPMIVHVALINLNQDGVLLDRETLSGTRLL